MWKNQDEQVTSIGTIYLNTLYFIEYRLLKTIYKALS